MRFLPLLMLMMCGTCLSQVSCMKDFQPVPTYAGGTSIEYRRGLLGNKILFENRTDNDLSIDEMTLDPKSKALILKGAKLMASASSPMKAFEGQQVNYIAGMAMSLEQSKIQMETTAMVLANLRGVVADTLAGASGMMTIRNERAVIRNAAPPSPSLAGILEQNIPAMIQLLAEIAGGASGSDQQIRAKSVLRELGHDVPE